MGNLVPAAVWFVPAAFSIWVTVKSHQFIGAGLVILIGATVLGWLTLNQFGFYQNTRMKRRLLAILGKTSNLPVDRFFVGFATPKYAGVIDAHEDVGFLCLTNDAIAFTSETRVVDLKKTEIKAIHFRPNIHTMVGLGRWISIEGERNGAPLRMQIEPRERRTMLGNLRYGKVLKKNLEEWRAKR